MKKLFKIVLFFSFFTIFYTLVDCNGNLDNRVYSSVSGGTYKYFADGYSYVFTFNSNKTVSGRVNGTDFSTLNLKWKESGREITVYQEVQNIQSTLYFFTANSTFTTLSYMGVITLARQ